MLNTIATPNTTDGNRRVKPRDWARAAAQTVSRMPETTSAIHAMTHLRVRASSVVPGYDALVRGGHLLRLRLTR